MYSTRMTSYINAPRAAVYRTLLDPHALSKWKVPDGMTGHVHAFDPREGGVLRVSLTYDLSTGTGKTSAHTDTYHGRFVTLIPDERIVEVDEFVTEDPALRGEMRITITLAEQRERTYLTVLHEGVPDSISPAANEEGWRMALAKLAGILEGDQPVRSVGPERSQPHA